MYKSYMKNVLFLATEAKLLLGKHCFLPLFATTIKNNITRSVINIIVYLPKTE